MREIKFRGKDSITGEWVYGDLSTKNLFNTTLIYPEEWRDVEVDPETIGQYTGLKDKNGVEIYEGDVCACKKRGISADAFEIFWMDEEGCWGWKESEESLDPFYQSIANYTEVIGNIHDNPELLGGAE